MALKPTRGGSSHVADSETDRNLLATARYRPLVKELTAAGWGVVLLKMALWLTACARQILVRTLSTSLLGRATNLCLGSCNESLTQAGRKLHQVMYVQNAGYGTIPRLSPQLTPGRQ